MHRKIKLPFLGITILLILPIFTMGCLEDFEAIGQMGNESFVQNVCSKGIKAVSSERDFNFGRQKVLKEFLPLIGFRSPTREMKKALRKIRKKCWNMGSNYCERHNLLEFVECIQKDPPDDVLKIYSALMENCTSLRKNVDNGKIRKMINRLSIDFAEHKTNAKSDNKNKGSKRKMWVRVDKSKGRKRRKGGRGGKAVTTTLAPLETTIPFDGEEEEYD